MFRCSYRIMPNSLENSSLLTYSADEKPDSSGKITDKQLREKINWFTDRYLDKNDDFIRASYSKIRLLLHPFEYIKTHVQSTFLMKNPVKITNAFMKMYEFLKSRRIPDSVRKSGVIRMFDIASAPGMFIIAAELFYGRFGISVDWHACSLPKTDTNTALSDEYGLYENNPERFTPCDLLNKDDIEKIIRQGQKYPLVTGDAGVQFDNYSELQELAQLDLQWRQMYLALNLCEKGGSIYIKLYTVLTEETHYLIDTISQYFSFVRVIKPFTSRLLNRETYIIANDRNDTPLKITIDRPIFKKYESVNKDAYLAYEHDRENLKRELITEIQPILQENNRISVSELSRKSPRYAKFYDGVKSLINTFNATFYMHSRLWF